MFGYIRDYRPLLDEEAYEMYRGIYCSFCKELGHRYGLLARMTLSYDGAFLALLRMSGQEPPGFSSCRCSFNPTKKCRQCHGCDAHLAYAAQVSMLMVYYKLEDNAADESFLKRQGAKVLKRLMRPTYQDACRELPEIDAALMQMMHGQQAAERQRGSVDACADPTARMLGFVAAYGEPDERRRRILERLGYCVGRYTYLMDALDDYEADRRKNRFNPLEVNAALDEAPALIRQTIGEAIGAWELLDVQSFGGLLENIIGYGLNNRLGVMLQEEGGCCPTNESV